ncbi:MAG: CPBP family intramembrane metalloprotease [Clostridiales bacterium]|jgi:membrane protease YdiL (CAAX protease family)|nr:CPBP family intramembrane metalloprotease [Clostridiales bacterium]
MMKKYNKSVLIIFIYLLLSILFSHIILPFIFTSLYGEDVETNDVKFVLLSQLIVYIIPILAILFFTEKNKEKKSLYFLGNLFEKPTKRGLIISFVIGFVIFAVIKFFNLFYLDLLLAVTNFNGLIEEAPELPFKSFLILFFVLTALPCLIEETLHRGLLYQSSSGKKSALLLSVLPFTLLHTPLDTAITALLISLFLFFIINRTDNIIYLYIVHFINNFLSLIFTYYIILPFEPQKLTKTIVLSSELYVYALISLIIVIISSMLFVFLIRLFEKKEHKYLIAKYTKIDKILMIFVFIIYIFLFVVRLL